MDFSSIPCLVKNLNFNHTSSFGDRVMQASESKQSVSVLLLDVSGRLVLGSDDSSLFDGFLVSINGDLLSVPNSFNKMISLKKVLELFLVDISDLGSVEVFKKEFSHLACLFFLSWIRWLLSFLNWN